MLSSAPAASAPILPGKPLLSRRPTLAGKVRSRDDAEMDDGSCLAPSSSGKRSKVAFDPEVQVQVVGEWEKGLELIRTEVRHGIERHRAGDNEIYDRLKEVFTTAAEAEDAPTPMTLRNHILALGANVSLLNKSCSGLVHAVLQCDWLGRDEAFVGLFIRFLGNLLSAQGSYLGAVMSMLIGKFVNCKPSRSSVVDIAAYSSLVPSSAGMLPDQPAVRKSQLHVRTHTALKYILQLIPAASSTLPPVLASTFPHSMGTQTTHTAYVRNLIRLSSYAPELRSEVLALITDRLVKIDVEVQVDMEDLEDDVGERLVHDVSPNETDPTDHADDSSDEDSDDESVLSEDSLDEEAQRLKILKSNVEKMDAILDILFSTYDPYFSGTSNADSEYTFDLLLNQFAAIILPTYRSRHTQFLLFHYAQTSTFLIDKFAGACVHLAFDQARSAIIKQSAAAYLASFVARGARVPSDTVRDVFDLLGAHLDGLRKEQETTCHGPDLRRYGTFYAMVQALLYIFCFRWRDLLASPEDYVDEEDDDDVDDKELTWAPGIRDTFTRTIYSKFNPLKVCSPSIVNEFARIANHLQFMYIYPLIETNKRLRLSQYSSTGRMNAAYGQPDRETALTVRKEESYHQLDAYFPFDPYHLPRSKRWIEGDYVEWKGIPGLDDQDPGGSSETDAEGRTADVGEGEDTDTDVDSD
ncbi:MAG: hypothetical protein M1837_001831 [Sclerophora amabilis]|nr:MAG: hypothetical protein M1837_001831 [Sclerophora amabilis]